MKKFFVSAALLVLFGALAVQAEPRTGSPKPTINRNPAAAMAQHEGSFAFLPKLGFVVPTGNFGDIANSGLGFQGAAEYYLRNDWAIGVSTSYAQANINNDTRSASEAAMTAQYATPVTVSSWKARTMQYGAHVRHLFATRSPLISPYVNGGVALYNSKTTISGTGATQQQMNSSTGAGQGETNFGFNMGGGVMWGFTPNIGLNVGMTYHNAFSDPSTNYFVFNGGLNFFFNPGR